MAISQDFPAISPTLTLNFARSKTLDPRVTFTRSSSATRVNPLGLVGLVGTDTPRFDHSYNSVTGAVTSLGLLIEESRSNLISMSQEMHTSPWGVASATTVPNDGVAPDGTITADRVISAGGGVFRAGAGVSNATAYTYSVFLKHVSGTGVVSTVGFERFGTTALAGTSSFNLITGVLVSNSANVQSSSITPYPSGWYRVSITAVSTDVTATVVTYTAASGNEFLVWGAQLEAGAFPTSYIPTFPTFTSRASSATYFDSTGVLQTAGTDVARSSAYLPDSSGAFRSAGPLLLEAASTNYVRNNTMAGTVAGTPGTIPTNWSWSGSAGISSQVVGTGTDSGITYIDIRFFGTVASVALPEVLIAFESGTTASVAQGQTWTASCYAKIVAGTQTGISNGEVYILGYNSTPTLSEASPASFLYSSLTGAFSACRVAKTYTFTNAATIYAQHRIDINLTPGGGSVVDFTIRIGMPQFEQGAFATSVISTSTATVTRSADASTSSTATRSVDNAFITGTNFSTWYNQTEGTFYVSSRFFADGEASQRIFQTDSGALSNINGVSFRTELGGNQIRAFDVNYSVSPAGLDFWTFTNSSVNVNYKTAFALKTNDMAAVTNFPNGTASIVTSATRTLLEKTTLRLGSSVGTTSLLNGHISQLSYYPRRLSNTQLQALTK